MPEDKPKNAMTPEEVFIRSLPGARQHAEDAAQMEVMKKIATNPLVRAFFAASGGNLNDVDSALARAEKSSQELETAWRAVADFNRHFTELGWIYYDPMNLEFVQNVNNVAGGGNLDAAETMLVEYYDEEHLRFMVVRWMRHAKAFQPRQARAQQALEDHLAGRYDATVLALIPIIDGMVQDTHEKRKGFFVKDAELSAWDSIVAHPKGLSELSRIFSLTRTKTNAEPLTIPYRHGIVHGMDLNFGSRLVATKLWALLFALRDWVLKSERGELKAPPPKREPTPAEVVARRSQEQKDLDAIQNWAARGLEFGRDLPHTGTPDLYGTGTSERTLVTMLCAWQMGNYGTVSECMCWAFRQLPKRKRFDELRGWLASRRLSSFSLQRFERESPGCVDIVTVLSFVDEPELTYTSTFRLMCETNTGKPSCEGATEARWGLLPWNAYILLSTPKGNPA